MERTVCNAEKSLISAPIKMLEIKKPKYCEIEIRKESGNTKVRISPDCPKEIIESLNLAKFVESKIQEN